MATIECNILKTATSEKVVFRKKKLENKLITNKDSTGFVTNTVNL